MNNRIKKKNGAMAISRVTDRRTGPTLCLERELMTKTSKTFAVMQGLRPLFLLRCRLAPKQVSANRHRRRNSLRSSGLHHTKENLENRLAHRDSLLLRFSFVSAPRFDVGESAICGWRVVRGVPFISPQTENGKGP